MSLVTLVLANKDRIVHYGGGLRCAVGEQLNEAHVWNTVCFQQSVGLYFEVISEEVKSTANLKR